MNGKIFNKVIWICLLLSVLFLHCFTLISQAHSVEDLSSAYLSKIGRADYHLKYRTAERNSYTIVSIVGHYIGDTFYPAYCINPELTGAETSPYTVSINEVYNNPAVWRVLMHGYPYQSPESMGLSMLDAYFITKMAIYCVIGVSDINAFNYDEGDEIAAKMLTKLKELVDYGLNGTETMKTGTLSYQKQGEFTEVENYYYQEYNVNSIVDIVGYKIANTMNFPDGTYISNTLGQEQNSFSNGESFRIYIPKNAINGNIDGKIKITAKSKVYPILYGEIDDPNLQNYLITSDPFGDEDIEINLNATINNGKVVVNKTDVDTGEAISGVVFGLFQNGQEVQRQTTNANGIAEFINLMPGNYCIKEISTLNNYVLDTQEYGIYAKYNGTATVNVTNEKKKGRLKIVKVDEDFNDIKLSNVEFKIYDENNNEIDTLITDENGEAISKLLPIDKTYTIKEILTNENYIFNDNSRKIILDENEIKTITITNKHKEGNLQIYKVDKDNKKITLGGVQFELFSEEFNKVIGKYTTNIDGEIYIPNLRTGNYKLHEIKTNKWYNLVDSKSIQVKWEETANTTIENELKKGQIKIIKVDKDNNEVKLKGVKFEVLNENNQVLEEVITNNNGEAMTNAYPVRDFEKLYIKETKTLEEYKLNDEIQEIVLEENQITTMTFENEVKKGQIKIIKVDKDNTEVKLKGVKFEVLDENENIIEKLVTDENGEAITSRLPISQKYKIREVDTLESYNLSEEIPVIELQEDEIKEIKFENEKKKGQIEVIKVDAENHEVRLEEIKFEVYDENDNLIQILVTDSEGKAITERIPIDIQYKVKETITNEFYKLSDKIQIVTLEENQITSLTFENYKKKGTIKISKVSSEYSELLNLEAGTKLSGAKFVILDEKENEIGTYTTDENGEIIIENLLYGHYTIYETESPEGFLLDNEPKTVFIENDGQIIDVEFKDSPIKPELPKTGFDTRIFEIIGLIIISIYIINKSIKYKRSFIKK